MLSGGRSRSGELPISSRTILFAALIGWIGCFRSTNQRAQSFVDRISVREHSGNIRFQPYRVTEAFSTWTKFSDSQTAQIVFWPKFVVSVLINRQHISKEDSSVAHFVGSEFVSRDPALAKPRTGLYTFARIRGLLCRISFSWSAFRINVRREGETKSVKLGV